MTENKYREAWMIEFHDRGLSIQQRGAEMDGWYSLSDMKDCRRIVVPGESLAEFVRCLGSEPSDYFDRREFVVNTEPVSIGHGESRGSDDNEPRHAAITQILARVDRDPKNTYKRCQDLVGKGLLISWDSPGGQRFGLRGGK